ncbi:MAG: hypothetical protein WAW52_04795 [Methanothrix sp.]
MNRKIVLPSLIIFIINVAASGNSSLSFPGDSPEMGPIGLEGNDTLLMPKMSFPEGAIGMELFDRLPVYSLNQSIVGFFLFPHHTGASNISVCISPFDLSLYLSGYQDTRGFSGKECAKTSLVLNGSDDSNGSIAANGTFFQLSSTSSGMYSLNFVDENELSVIISVPLLITEGQTVMQMPSIVNAEEPYIQVKMNTTVPGNQNKIFAVVMISQNDYENSSLDIAKNNTTNSLDITLSLVSKTLQISGPLKVSSELLMKLLPLLPANSAVGLQESTQSGVDLILLPDKSWEKGEYILTGGIYSPGKGLLGITQSEVEVI